MWFLEELGLWGLHSCLLSWGPGIDAGVLEYVCGLSRLSHFFCLGILLCFNFKNNCIFDYAGSPLLHRLFSIEANGGSSLVEHVL